MPKYHHELPSDDFYEVHVVPISPLEMETLRYQDRPTTAPWAEEPRIYATMTSFERGSPTPEWTTCRHPEGQLYFRSTEQRCCTDLWLYDVEVSRELDKILQHLRKNLQGLNDIPKDTEIVVHRRGSQTEKEWVYYLASASTRSIFWLEEVDAQLLSCGLVPVHELTQLKDAQNMQYWTHVHLFPGHFKVTSQILDEIADLLLYQAFDARTSKTSTVPWSSDEMYKMFQMVKETRVGKHSGSVCIVARSFYFLYHGRLLNFHGERVARLERNRKVYQSSAVPRRRSILFRVMSPFLLYLPDQNLSHIEEVWVDWQINYRPWSEFVYLLQKDWEDTRIPALVLLAVNVVFLGTQNTALSTSGGRTVGQIASYVSIILSLGCLFLRMMLLRQHGDSIHGTATQAAQYLRRREDSLGGLELLALSVSFPSVFVVWGLLALCIAVCWTFFYRTSLHAVITTAIFLAIVVIAVTAVGYLTWNATQRTSRLRRYPHDALKSFLHETNRDHPSLGDSIRDSRTWRSFSRKCSQARGELEADRKV